ncbi:hypothetical protein KZZ52_22540 [Dactylosporangium sp. AC04546]|uniref:hypothetical protein n=1 Tax=Dactylosporangium sp. AC04546 TaxID=2862460 RepID=UPI002E7B351C|nr:hypothetical protein [Dactylosporangium sp. AC04546]WVK88059.1 hypothetical protein KZZ52_22540 [Dactylosporangium sp. AC04546]
MPVTTAVAEVIARRVRQLHSARARAHGGDARYEPAAPDARFVITLPPARQ